MLLLSLMARANIDTMIPRTYTESSPRKQTGYEGQKSAIRFIDTTDGADMQRMKHIEDLESEFFLPGKLDDKDLLKWANDRKKELIWVGIAGNEQVSDAEKGELQGWIYFNRMRCPGYASYRRKVSSAR